MLSPGAPGRTSLRVLVSIMTRFCHTAKRPGDAVSACGSMRTASPAVYQGFLLPARVDFRTQILVVQVLDLAERMLAKRRDGRGRRVLPGLLRVARAGDDGGDARLLGHPAQRRLCGGRPRAGVRGVSVRFGGDGGELGGRPHAGRVVHPGERLTDVE